MTESRRTYGVLSAFIRMCDTGALVWLMSDQGHGRSLAILDLGLYLEDNLRDHRLRASISCLAMVRLSSSGRRQNVTTLLFKLPSKSGEAGLDTQGCDHILWSIAVTYS